MKELRKSCDERYSFLWVQSVKESTQSYQRPPLDETCAWLNQSRFSLHLNTVSIVSPWKRHITTTTTTTLVWTCTKVNRNKPRRKATILWNQQVQTDRTIPSNKPDIIIRDNEKRTCMLIDVAIPGDRNVIKKEAEKILKYKDRI